MDIKRLTAILLTASLLMPVTGCTKKKTSSGTSSSSPEIHCDEIKLTDDQKNADLKDYCTVTPSDATLTLTGDLDMSIGTHEESYTIGTSNGGFATGEIEYTVERHAVANAHWDDGQQKYVANDGFVEQNGQFVAKSVCGDGTTYDEASNTCVAAAQPAQPAQNVPSQGSSSSGTASGNSSGTSGGNQSSGRAAGSGTKSFPIDMSNPNRQQAINNAYNECWSFCSAYGTCGCAINNSVPSQATAYTATYGG